MTHDDAVQPADLSRWLAAHLPGVIIPTDVSWARDTAKVWRLDSDGPTAYVKISSTAKAYARETHGYQHAASALAPDQAPQLLASDPTLRAVLTAALPGSVVHSVKLTVAAEVRAHRLAGRLLARWHAHPEPEPAQARETIMVSVAGQAAEAAACLDSLGEQLTAAERALVSEVARDLPDLAAGLPLVYLHGDFSPRNWLWRPETATLGAIDFEEAGHGLAVQDMVWLCGALWPTRPDLRAAFFDEFGRDLTAQEHRVLLLLTTRLAVSYLATGLAEQDTALIDRGRTALRGLAGTRP
jgi:Ser/Thr protein kinase RdoA (MazF antagonist)